MKPWLKRFWLKVRKTDQCWEWTGCKNVKGYGRLFIHKNGQRDVQLAHRLSYQAFIGDIPEGMFVLHGCDNPSCVKPDHLFLGTAQDNSSDMVAKDRHARGERSGVAKLTDVEVEEIKKLSKEGVSGVMLAARFQVSVQTICGILKGRTWKHVLGSV
jgi:hypothetical protein